MSDSLSWKSSRYWYLVAVVVVFIGLFAAYTVSLSGPTQLTKQEALSLMNLQAKAVMATADRNEYAQMLYLKYGLSPEFYSIDIARGCFMLRRTQPVEDQNEKDTNSITN